MAYLHAQQDVPDADEWHHLRDITSALGPATNVEFESVRRAIPRLAEELLVEVRVDEMTQWGVGRTQTYVRLLSPASVGS
jgi:hypothetical protein